MIKRDQSALKAYSLVGKKHFQRSEWYVRQAERTVTQAGRSVHGKTLKKSFMAEDKGGKICRWKDGKTLSACAGVSTFS